MRRVVVADPEPGSRRVALAGEEQPPRLLHPELFLELDRAHRSHRLELVLQARHAHPEATRERVHAERLVVRVADEPYRLRHPLRASADQRDLPQPGPLLSHREPVRDFAEDEWSGMPTVYPCVPGHEIVGRVTKVGSAVTKFRTGDVVGVGCLVDSDGTCPSCREHYEQFCPSAVYTYNSPDRHSGKVTYGGYSDSVVVDERFVLRVPKNLDLAGAAPLLCAGITTWSPLRRQGVTKGKKVGVVGLGGLGHMGVKFARALGAHIAVFTTSPAKTEDALRLGAHEVVVSKDANAMSKLAGSFDMILDTVSAVHDLHPYLHALKRDGNLTLVGAPDQPHAVSAFGLIFGNKSLSGSLIGGIQSTQEMLDFCGEHGITSDRRGDPDPEGERCVRAPAQVGREVPLLDRHGVAPERVSAVALGRTSSLVEPASRGAGFVVSARPGIGLQDRSTNLHDGPSRTAVHGHRSGSGS